MVNEQFNSRVVDVVEQCKQVALEYLRDDTTTAMDTGGGTDRRSSFSTTKRETVMLPKFSGEEKNCFSEVSRVEASMGQSYPRIRRKI